MDHGDEIVDGRSNRWRTENETFTESTFNEFRSTKLIIDRSTDRSISKSFRPNRTTSQMFGMDLDTHTDWNTKAIKIPCGAKTIKLTDAGLFRS